MGDRRWSVIVANPPYVAHVDPHLSQGDLRFEPQGALTDGSDGLGAIRRIIEESPEYLERGGWLFIEHGYDQAKAVNTLFKARGFADISLRRDLAGRPRASGGCWQ
jgi:release factor glutamine methyltransferase